MKKVTGTTPKNYKNVKIFGLTLFLLILGISGYWVVFEKLYENKVYPNVTVDDIPFGGKTKAEVQAFWEAQNIPFEKAVFEFRFDTHIATISGSTLELGYDATLSATQAFAIGRSGNFSSDMLSKFFGNTQNLSAYFRWKSDIIDTTLNQFKDQIDIPVQDALFQFENKKVTAFKASKDGRRVNIQETINHFQQAVHSLPHAPSLFVVINVPVDIITPKITTEKVNSFGIKELIGRGYSEFQGSIPGRIHNVALAANRVNGTLIPPGETFSFNDTVGDISAATGYQSAYIIKDGRTVLGDGGGVCQVSTTMFRAALATGLPIQERQAHAYRVHYYEEAGYKAGIDATVFSPSVDLKIKNDTPAYILIQTKTDLKNVSLTVELYGTSDGRNAKITNHVVGAEIAPPPPLYQDDPTLKVGVVKQVDWAAWGAKASFHYTVTRGNETIQDVTFASNYRPWQAVYLNGTQ
ncbi:MAG: VanW family protein [Patescibacteria group bacterium]